MESSGPEPISSAGLKATEVIIDLSNPVDLDLAQRKIHTFRYLESVILEGETTENTLRKLFYRLSIMKNVTSITLKENELTKVPENIASIKGLTSLSVEGNIGLDYGDLFSKIKNVQLSELKLTDNDLKKMPPTIAEVSSLTKIQLSGNVGLDLFDCVEQLSKLRRLTTLALPVNYIFDLPVNIDKLTSLQVLDVSNNNLTEFPDQISSLKAINNLSIQGNLLLDPTKDMAKLKGNNIQYLALDKELPGEDIEQIKKMFPNAQIDFPINKSSEEANETETFEEEEKPVYKGELKVKKDAYIFSAAYLLYGTLYQGLNYTFDTLNFAERYNNFGYENTSPRLNNRFWGPASVNLYQRGHRYEPHGKRNETWFRLIASDANMSSTYPELRSFSGMYWVYRGELTKKQFRRTYISKRQRLIRYNIFGFRIVKRKRPIRWNDIRIEFDKNNNLFVITLKSDTAFTQFTAYPRAPDFAVEKSRPGYNQRYLLYKKALLRREQRFNKDLAKNKARYDQNYKKMKEYAWKELQLKMSDDEKVMSKEEWLGYFDGIVANEQKALDKTPLSTVFIQRSLFLRGYNTFASVGPVIPDPRNPANLPSAWGTKAFNVDFVDSKGAGKLAVTNIIVLDGKRKQSYQLGGTFGLSPNIVFISQFASYSLLVELRNGSWGYVSAEEIDKYNFEPNKVFAFNTEVFDKNLSTIGELLKNVVK